MPAPRSLSAVMNAASAWSLVILRLGAGQHSRVRGRAAPTAITQRTASRRRSRRSCSNSCPGSDAFPTRRRPRSWASASASSGAALRRARQPGGAALDTFLAPEFKGGRLRPPDEDLGRAAARSSRSSAPAPLPPDLTLDRALFRKELAALLGELASRRRWPSS